MEFMRSLFLQKLPRSVQQIAAAVGDKVELSELAEMADSIMEVTGETARVAAVKDNSELTQLKAEMAELKSMFQSVLELSTKSQPQGRVGRSSSRGRSPFRRKGIQQNTPCVGTTLNSERRLPGVSNLVRGREMGEPEWDRGGYPFWRSTHSPLI